MDPRTNEHKVDEAKLQKHLEAARAAPDVHARTGASEEDPKTITRAVAHQRILRTLNALASDAERRKVLAAIATLYEA
jgi:hypothetical protein